MSTAGSQNQNSKSPWSPFAFFKSAWQHRNLIKQFTRREVAGRYRGSYLGIVWSFITPLLMLVIYTFVFSVVFQARWETGTDSKIEFAMVLFCGITTFNLLAEMITRAPGLVTGNVNYVKKVVFPLEILPVVSMGSALVHAGISLLVLILGVGLFLGQLQWTVVFVPLVLLPLLLMGLGVSWVLASLGVFLRDIGHVIGIFTQALMFMSPVFYPVTAIPESLRGVFLINPLTYVVEDMRRIIVWGQMPDWQWLLLGTLSGAVVALLGYVWFQRTKGGFADVL